MVGKHPAQQSRGNFRFLYNQRTIGSFVHRYISATSYRTPALCNLAGRGRYFQHPILARNASPVVGKATLIYYPGYMQSFRRRKRECDALAPTIRNTKQMHQGKEALCCLLTSHRFTHIRISPFNRRTFFRHFLRPVLRVWRGADRDTAIKQYEERPSKRDKNQF